MGVAAVGGKDIHIGALSPLPVQKLKKDATWGGKSMLYRNRFVNFFGPTEKGNRQSVFGLNPWGSDHIPIAQFYDTEFHNVGDDAFGYFYDPK